MPTPIARFKRGVARDIGLIVLGLFLGGLVLLTGHLARDDASTVATDAAVTAAVQQAKREAYRQDIEAWKGRLAGCERGKTDRQVAVIAYRVIAKSQRAQADYLGLVLHASSVKQDVKDAAIVNQRKQDWSARTLTREVIQSLLSRTGSNLDCRRAYPKPPAPDGVKPLI